MTESSFLSLEDILFIHSQEIEISGGEPNIRDEEGIKACVDAPKASFDGKYLHDLFGMAATPNAFGAVLLPAIRLSMGINARV